MFLGQLLLENMAEFAGKKAESCSPYKTGTLILRGGNRTSRLGLPLSPQPWTPGRHRLNRGLGGLWSCCNRPWLRVRGYWTGQKCWGFVSLGTLQSRTGLMLLPCQGVFSRSDWQSSVMLHG